MHLLFNLRTASKRTKVSALILILLSACSSVPRKGGQETGPGSTYHIQYAQCNSRPCLKVRFTFLSQEDTVELKLPKNAAGHEDLYHSIQNLKTLSKTAVLVQTEDPSIFRLKTEKGRPLELSYEVIQDFDGPLDQDSRYYRNVIQADFFHVFGEGLFVYPLKVIDAGPIRLEWEVPPDFKLANSLGIGAAAQNISLPMEKVRQGTYLAGRTLRFEKTEVLGNPVWAAFVGKFGFSDSDFVKNLKDILTVERNFWGDHQFPYFFVSAISISKEALDRGGQGRTNGFAVFDGEVADSLWLKHLLAHELFHTWNGHRIEKEKNEGRSKWFSEGFTEYYADLSLLRSDLIKLPQYLELQNQSIRHYFVSPARNASVERVEKEYWINSMVQGLPYDQGRLLALKWNSDIKKDSHGQFSLDEGMRDLLKGSEKPGFTSNAISVSSAFQKYLITVKIADEIKNFVDDGETITFDQTQFGPCVSLKSTLIDKFDLGLDPAELKKNKRAVSVSKKGPAYLAGIREGDAIISTNIYHGETSKMVTIKVKSPSGPKTFQYLPKGPKIQVPQFQLDPKKFRRLGEVCQEYFEDHSERKPTN